MAFKKTSKLGLGILLGAAAGAVAGLFLAPKAGKELRKDAKKLYDEISKNPEAAVKDIFGKVSKESVNIYQSAQKEVVAQLQKVSGNYKKLDTSKYKEIALQAVEKVKEDKELPQAQLKKLAAYLETDIKKLVGGTAKKKVTKRPTAKRTTKKV
ncbi:MAG: YtxH-like protein [Microgenomates bacterium OLB23]|nr:MAG: YtxH-like protein [Microgenomates bacterium OLB23]